MIAHRLRTVVDRTDAIDIAAPTPRPSSRGGTAGGIEIDVRVDAWKDEHSSAPGDERPDSRFSAAGRLVALAGLIAVAGLAIGGVRGDHPALPMMSQRICVAPGAWRLVVLDPATDRLFGVDLYGGLDRLDLRSGRVERWGTSRRQVQALALHPSGDTLATSDEDGSIFLRDAAAGTIRRQVRPLGTTGDRRGPAVTCLAYRPDGRTLAAGSADGVIRFLDAADGRVLGEAAGPGGRVTHLAFGPGGRLLVWATADGMVHLGDGATGQQHRTLRVARDAIRHLALSPDGRRLAVSLRPARSHPVGQILVTDLAVPDAPALVLGKSYQDALAFTPDGRCLVAAGNDSNVRQWDLASGRLVAVGAGHSGYILHVLITPDGRQAITSGEDGLLGQFDLRAPDTTTDAATRT